VRRVLFAIVEIVILSALILATRCANYGDVFVNGEIFFTDADCYARMTRVRMCVEHPGTVIRHHSFENFPEGTTPHTTAPLDYLIAMLTVALKPFTNRAIDLAGAIVSPLLALLTGWFLWWWSWRMRLPYRSAMLLLFALSPIVVHGTELGRPDHQSLLLGLIAVALCAEWSLGEKKVEAVATQRSLPRWGLISGTAWGLALWVSWYEPLVMLTTLAITQFAVNRRSFFGRQRLMGWIVCGAIVLIAFAIEQRLPQWPQNKELFVRWSKTIGELSPVSFTDRIWIRWAGLLVIPFPAFLWIAGREKHRIPMFLVTLVAAMFALTLWQARWGYFFLLVFALTLPLALGTFWNRIVGGVLLVISLYPILQDWDERLWPNDAQRAALIEQRTEALAFRQIARQIGGPFLAPWWWSPAIAYWSGQPGVAGSSHEALPGIETSARLFLAGNTETAREILAKNQVAWVVSYEADRIAANSSTILGVPPADNSLGRVLDRTPSQAPPAFQVAAQNSSAKLFRVRFFQEK
jgi:hypothetical protein